MNNAYEYIIKLDKEIAWEEKEEEGKEEKKQGSQKWYIEGKACVKYLSKKKKCKL